MSKDKESRRINQGDIFNLLKQKKLKFYMKQENIVSILQDIVPHSKLDAPRISRISNQKEQGTEDFSGKADEFFTEFFADVLEQAAPEDLDDILDSLKEWLNKQALTFKDMDSEKYDTCEKWIRQMLKCALKNLIPANPKPSAKSSHKLRGHNITPAGLFIGRKTLLNEIAETLKAEHAAVLRGMAGIGKSFLARQFAALHREDYERIHVVSADSEDPEGLMRKVILKLEFEGIKAGRKTEEQLFSAKLDAVMELKKDSLLIIDGLDTLPKDIHLLRDILRGSQLRMIITTRLTDFLSGMKSFSVPALDFGEQCELFETYYGRKVSSQEENMRTLRKILAYLDGNTMYIEQLAKYIKKCEYTLDEALKYLHDGCCFPDKWFVRKDDVPYEGDTLIVVFSKILFPYDVSPERMRVLQALAKIPAEGISRRKLLDGFDAGMRHELRRLEDEGYVVLDQTAERNMTKIHQLTRDAILARFPVGGE